MKKLSIIFFAAALLTCGNAFSNIRHIVDTENSSKNDIESEKFSVSKRAKCRSAGYSKTACPPEHYASDPCPYDNTMAKFCCSNEYKYTPDECKAKGLIPSQDTCNELFACIKAEAQ